MSGKSTPKYFIIDFKNESGYHFSCGNRLHKNDWGDGIVDKNRIVMNTLVYAKEIENGVGQADLIRQIADLAVGTVEIRREYIQHFKRELPKIRERAHRDHMRVLYSVPDEIFVNGRINPNLQQYLNEGKAMGIEAIKWNVGDFAHFKGRLKDALQPIVSQGIQVNVENDQTETSGSMQSLISFLTAVEANAIDLGCVYDMGNWRFVQENELAAAAKLGRYVRYIHVKDVRNENGKPVVCPLDDGVIQWRDVLDRLPQNVPVAIEYPVDDKSILIKGIQLLEKYGE
jgi:hypothetical protein